MHNTAFWIPKYPRGPLYQGPSGYREHFKQRPTISTHGGKYSCTTTTFHILITPIQNTQLGWPKSKSVEKLLIGFHNTSTVLEPLQIHMWMGGRQSLSGEIQKNTWSWWQRKQKKIWYIAQHDAKYQTFDVTSGFSRKLNVSNRPWNTWRGLGGGKCN